MKNLAVIASFLGLMPWSAAVLPHGAEWELRVVGQKIAFYDATVRTSPKKPRPGRLHVELQLIDPETLTYVDRASASAVARLRDGEETAPVYSRYQHPWHEMDIALGRPGSWDVVLAIDAPRAQGKLSFRVDVSD